MTSPARRPALYKRRLSIGAGGGLAGWGVSRRKAEVVMLVRRGDSVLLSTKSFYPAGLYRLPTGGLRLGERPADGFERELAEETGFMARGVDYLAEIRYVLALPDSHRGFVSHVFAVSVPAGEPRPEDLSENITGYRWVDWRTLRDVAGQLRLLPPEWRDWGEFRSIAHDVTYELLAGEEKQR